MRQLWMNGRGKRIMRRGYFLRGEAKPFEMCAWIALVGGAIGNCRKTLAKGIGERIIGLMHSAQIYFDPCLEGSVSSRLRARSRV